MHIRMLPPAPASATIDRPRLSRHLESVSAVPLTVVVAPAGSGKTTLLASWAASQNMPVAWLSIDEALNNLGAFTAHFAAAVQQVESCQCEEAVRLAETTPAPDQVGALLTEGMLDLNRDIVIILDDYQTISERTIHQMVTAIVSRPPPRLHVVISSRVDPPLPLARYRTLGMLVEIRNAQLRFTDEEALRFFRQEGWTVRELEAVQQIQERTEGWAAGLRLASLAICRDDNARTPGPVTASASLISAREYLLEEVLSQQDDRTRDFLLRTSVVERVSTPLADALADGQPGTAESEEILESLIRANLFLVRLGEDGEWYRYSHLFRQALQQCLAVEWSADRIATLHLRASGWFEDHGLIDEAISHALRAGDANRAAAIIERHAPTALATHDRRPVERWLMLLPAGVMDRRPALLLIRAMCAQIRGASDELAAALGHFDNLLGPTREEESEDAHVLHLVRDVMGLSLSAFQRPREEVATLARTAIDQLPPERRLALAEAIGWRGLSLALLGMHTQAVLELEDMLRREADRDDIVPLTALGTLAHVRLHAGDMENAEHAASRLLRWSMRVGHSGSMAWAHVELGVIRYERNDLTASSEHMATVVSLQDSMDPIHLCEATACLALAHQAQGRQGIARSLIDDLIERFEASDAQQFLPLARAFRAKLALAQGDPTLADRWLAAYDERELPATAIWTTSAQLITAQLYVERDRPAEALPVIERFLAERRADHYAAFETLGLAVKALALHALGRRADAMASLAAALGLGERSGVFRRLVDLGPPLARLLQELKHHGHHGALVDRLLAALATCDGRTQLTLQAAGRHQPSPRADEIAEQMTDREMQVLDLLGRRLSNKEIADELFISPLTVKRHTTNIYGKLGVSSRRQAVLKARALGLLTTA
jgi:LuxR family maltose regulon positive regulatory protein